jgi:hypothetical protein
MNMIALDPGLSGAIALSRCGHDAKLLKDGWPNEN